MQGQRRPRGRTAGGAEVDGVAVADDLEADRVSQTPQQLPVGLLALQHEWVDGVAPGRGGDTRGQAGRRDHLLGDVTARHVLKGPRAALLVQGERRLIGGRPDHRAAGQQLELDRLDAAAEHARGDARAGRRVEHLDAAPDRQQLIVDVRQLRVDETQVGLVGQAQAVAYAQQHEQRGQLGGQLRAVDAHDARRQQRGRDAHDELTSGTIRARPRSSTSGLSIAFACAISRQRVGSP